MGGISHFHDLRLGSDPLGATSARQVWAELLAAARAGAGGGVGPGAKLEGRLEFTFQCDSAALAAGAARVIQAHWRGMHVRRLMKCGPTAPFPHPLRGGQSSLLSTPNPVTTSLF